MSVARAISRCVMDSVWVQKQPSGNPGALRSKRVRRAPPTLEPVRSPLHDHTQARRHQVRVAREVEPADLSLLASLSTDLSHERNRNQGDRPGTDLPRVREALVGGCRDRSRCPVPSPIDDEGEPPDLGHGVWSQPCASRDSVASPAGSPTSSASISSTLGTASLSGGGLMHD